jgi:ketosteroid isomerase-like protein
MSVDPDRRHVLRGVAGGLFAGVAAWSSVGAAPAHAAQVGADTARQHDRVLRVANAAMDRFDAGWMTGDWQPFLEMLTDDFSFWFPEEPARGRFEGTAGRRAVAEWTAFHAGNGNRVHGERRRVTVAGHRVFYEYDSVGSSAGTAAYRNWEMIVLEVRGNRVSALHEYWGDARPADGGAIGAP